MNDHHLGSLFPAWSIVFAPIGAVVLGRGWWHIRDEQRTKISFALVDVGALMFAYGFMSFLVWLYKI